MLMPLLLGLCGPGGTALTRRTPWRWLRCRSRREHVSSVPWGRSLARRGPTKCTIPYGGMQADKLRAKLTDAGARYTAAMDAKHQAAAELAELVPRAIR